MIENQDKRAIYPSLAGKRVLLTGGASGIGAGTVAAFVRQGATVHFFDIAEAEGRELAAQLGELAQFRLVDMTDIPALTAAIADEIARGGAFDVLVNNAASDDRHGITDVTEAFWDERFSVNLKHHFFSAQAVIPAMRAKGGGAIINLGSISWHLGLSDLTLYQTAKAAIEGLTRSLAREVGRDGIRVTCVIPGNVQTPRQQRWYTPHGESEIVAAQCMDGRLIPEDIAAMILFLASDDARLITAHNYWVDAGWR